MTEQNDEQLAFRAMQEGSYEEAVRLLQPLAERNSAYALLSLGWINETGAAGAPDKSAAKMYYEGAAAQGDATAFLYLGRLLLREGREPEARTAFKLGVQLNNEECKSELAQLADKATKQLAQKALEEREYGEAVRLLQPLAERNSRWALLTLGVICERGSTGSPDWSAACSYYTRAASQGSIDAYFELGRLLMRQGKDAEARQAFQASAEKGHLPSMSRLGAMLMEGRGGTADATRGRAWLETAAAKGHIYARAILLTLEARNANSISEKVAAKIKLAKLAFEGRKEISKNPVSDRVR